MTLDQTIEGSVHESVDYEDFAFIDSNRPTMKAHVQNLIRSFQETPETAKARPILVNENLEIIDGQHRYLAWKALGFPIYYIVGKGLTIKDAQRLNSNQRNWTMMDYARSFAMEGNPSYQRFLDYAQEYKVQSSLVMMYCEGYDRHNQSRDFKEGRFKVMKDHKLIEERLSMLSDLYQLNHTNSKIAFGRAMIKIFKSDEYDHEHFLEKLRLHGDRELTNFSGSQNDWLRAIENVYNKYARDDKIVRLFD